jgi:hypothetical protein
MSRLLYAHIEYRREDDHDRYFYFGEIHIERDYDLLDLLILNPRGAPFFISALCFRKHVLYVSEEESSMERSISRQSAEQWVARGNSVWMGEHFITDPEFHHLSWLSTFELEQVYQEHLSKGGSKLSTVEAALAALTRLNEARLVFWFDN